MKNRILFLLLCPFLLASQEISLETDFLLWQPSGLFIPGDQSDNFPDRLLVYPYAPKGEYLPGFRLGLYAYCPETSMGLIYTHHSGTISTPQNPLGSDWVYLIYSPKFDIPPFRNFSGLQRISSNLDYLDLDLASCFHPNSYFTLLPHIGVRLLSYSTTSNLLLSGNVQGTATVLDGKVRTHISAFGIEGGIGLKSCSYCGFSLFGSVSGALLTSRVQDRENWNFFSPSDLSSLQFFASTSSNALLFNLGTSLGLEYITSLFAHPLVLRASYEQLYLSQLSIGFSGLTMGAEVTY